MEWIQTLEQQYRQRRKTLPEIAQIDDWIRKAYQLLFPLVGNRSPRRLYDELYRDLTAFIASSIEDNSIDAQQTAGLFFQKLPDVSSILKKDLTAFIQFDPAANSEEEIIVTYPGFFAIAVHRMAHQLHRLQIPLLPRYFSELAHSKTGIDIHPAAEIGHSFFIDHGTGVVVGATAVIGNHVSVYQGVTLGALQVDNSLRYIKRHPTIEDHVVIYANATILGGTTVIGHHSIIGGNVWLTHSVEPWSIVQHRADIQVRPKHLNVIDFII